MKISFSSKLKLFSLLILLNLILRLPTTLHEIGWDSYEIHALANSITIHGEAQWWVNIYSIIGMYPLSYASSVPFLLSGISQMTSLDMEFVIWIFCFILAIISICFIYILARILNNDDLFKFLIAYFYTISSGFLTLTTWTSSSRGLFIAFLPLCIYILLKPPKMNIIYGLTSLFLFLFLLSTHNLFFYLLPIIVSFFFVRIIWKVIPNRILEKNKNLIAIALLILSFLLLLIPLIGHVLWVEDPELTRYTRNIDNSSIYTIIVPLITSYLRYIGPSFIFIVGGYTYLLFKNKTKSELIFFLMFISLLPLLYIPTYSKWFIIPLIFTFIAIAFTNLFKFYSSNALNIRKYVLYLFIAFLILHTSYSAFFQFLNNNENYISDFRSMDEKSYSSALWIKENTNGNIFWNNDLVGMRIFAISGKPVLFGGPLELAYNYTNISDISISKNSPFTSAFYEHGPYVKTPGTPYTEGYTNLVRDSEYNSKLGKFVVSKYNLSYIIEASDRSQNTFIRSIHQDKNILLYDNGLIHIWNI